MTIQSLIQQTEDLKNSIASNFDESLSSRADEVRTEAEREAREKLNAEIEKLESFKILTYDDPVLKSIGTRAGVFENALGTNQGQAAQVLRLLEHFKQNPSGPCPELKSEPVVPVDVIRLVARCALIAERFEAATPQLLTAMLAGVPV